MAVAAVDGASTGWRWARVLREAGALVVGAFRVRLSRACGGTVAGGWLISVRWAAVALLSWASTDLALHLARNAWRWWELTNVLAVAVCLLTGVAVRAVLRGAILLPLHVALFLITVDGVRMGGMFGDLDWVLLAASPQGVAGVVLLTLMVLTRRPGRSATPADPSRWWWLAPAGLLLLVVQIGRGMPLTATPQPVVVAVVVALAVVCLLEPRAAVTVAAVASVGVAQVLLVGVDVRAGMIPVAATVVSLPMAAGWNIRRACRS